MATSLLEAVDRHDLPVVDAVIARLRAAPVGDFSLADFVAAFDENGNTLLHRCVVSSMGCRGEELAQLLIDAGAVDGQMCGAWEVSRCCAMVCVRERSVVCMCVCVWWWYFAPSWFGTA